MTLTATPTPHTSTTRAGPAAPQPTRLYALDGLRLFCALAVAGYHFGNSWRLDGVRQPAEHLPHAAPVLIYGFLGVEVFFLISGFVIGMSGWDRTVRGFVVSRVTRLYPAFWCCVPLTALVVTLWPISTGVPISTVPTPTDVALNLTMVPTLLNAPMVDSVYWTLLIEIYFYLIFAVLISAGLSRHRVTVFCAIWLAGSVWFSAIAPRPLTELLVPAYAPYFVAGLTMFMIRRFGPDRWLWLLLVASWAVSLVRVQERAADLHPGYPVPTTPAPILITVAFGALLAIALGATDRLRWRGLATAGALTYPFYLLHQRVGYAMIRAAYEHTGLPAAVLITAVTLVLLVAAWLIHRLVERPLATRLRGLLTPRRRSTPAPSPAVPAGMPLNSDAPVQARPGQTRHPAAPTGHS